MLFSISHTVARSLSRSRFFGGNRTLITIEAQNECGLCFCTAHRFFRFDSRCRCRLHSVTCCVCVLNKFSKIGVKIYNNFSTSSTQLIDDEHFIHARIFSAGTEHRAQLSSTKRIETNTNKIRIRSWDTAHIQHIRNSDIETGRRERRNDFQRQ